MNVSPLVMMASAVAVFLSGCGPSEMPAASGKPAARAPRNEGPDTVEFHTRADTVTALNAADNGTVWGPGKTARIGFMIQIGAFRDPHHASAVQKEARKRYRMPVLNDFLAGPALYQIRIGFFESRENARAFQQQMRREYPSDYSDSWIVQLKP